MADPFMEFDLPAEIHRLKAEATWSTGQNARTLVKYDDFRVVLIALGAEARVPEHKAEGRITIHVLSGHTAFAQADSWRSITALLMTSAHSKRARYSSRLPGPDRNRQARPWPVADVDRRQSRSARVR